MRMRNLQKSLYGLTRCNSNLTSVWTTTILSTGLLKIHTFTWTGHSLTGPFFFEGTITGAAYLGMLQTRILSAIQNLYGDEFFTCNKTELGFTTIEMSGSTSTELYPDGGWVEEVPSSTYLSLLIWHFYLWGTVKNDMYWRRPALIEELRAKIKGACATTKPDTLTALVRSAIQRHGHCIQVGGDHFKHIP